MAIRYWYNDKDHGIKNGGVLVTELSGPSGPQYCFEYHQGRVVDTYEQNGYHDSYFQAVVYLEDEDRAIEIEYASTAYGGGGAAYIDASPELRAKYDDYKRRQAEADRFSKIEHLMEIGVPAYLCSRVFYRLNRLDIYGECVKLLATKKFRSDFRRSLCQQLIAWLMNDNPEYSRPFSDRQARYLAPYRVH